MEHVNEDSGFQWFSSCFISVYCNRCNVFSIVFPCFVLHWECRWNQHIFCYFRSVGKPQGSVEVIEDKLFAQKRWHWCFTSLMARYQRYILNISMFNVVSIFCRAPQTLNWLSWFHVRYVANFEGAPVTRRLLDKADGLVELCQCRSLASTLSLPIR